MRLMSKAKSVQITQSGGFTGRARSVKVDLSVLSTADAAALEQIVAAALPLMASATPRPAGADLRQYDVVVEDQGTRHEFTVAEGNVPPPVKLLISRVFELGRQPH
jgi:hypothetical protein